MRFKQLAKSQLVPGNHFNMSINERREKVLLDYSLVSHSELFSQSGLLVIVKELIVILELVHLQV